MEQRWVQLQAEGGMQSNTDKSCLLIPFTSAPNTGQNRSQVLPHAGHADPLAIGAKKSVHFSTVSFAKTSAWPLHPVQVLALPSDDITCRLKKPEFYLTQVFWLIQLNNNHDPLILSSNNLEINCWNKLLLSISQDAYVSDASKLVKIPLEKWPRQSIKKRASIVFASDRKWEPMSEREIGKGETPFWVVRLLLLISNLCCGPRNHRMLSQRFVFLSLIMLQIVFFLNQQFITRSALAGRGSYTE